jgi:hypothetical protein
MRETKTTPSEEFDNSRSDYMIPHTNRPLVLTAKGGWRVMEVRAKIAFRRPTLIVKMSTQNANKREKTHI